MKKDFKNWHNKKAGIDAIVQRPFFHEGEIWFCHLGANVGFEQDGMGTDFLRPVLIVRKFNKDIFWGIPLTRNKKKLPFYFSFPFASETSTAILSQIRLTDARRLSHLLGEIRDVDFIELKKRFIALLP